MPTDGGQACNPSKANEIPELALIIALTRAAGSRFASGFGGRQHLGMV